MMIHTYRKQRFLSSALPLGALLFCVYLLIDFAHCADAVRHGLHLCATSVVPSLFPFMVMSRYLQNSGIFDRLPMRVCKIGQTLFALSPASLGVWLCGAVGGFGVGPKCACELYAEGKIEKEECERLIGVSNLGGPAFCIGFVGAALCGNIRIGVLLYVAQFLCALVCAVLFSVGVKRQTPHRAVTECKKKQGLTEAIAACTLPMLTLCAFVLFFSVSASVLDTLLAWWHTPPMLRHMLCGLMEVNEGTLRTVSYPPLLALVCNAFFLGFGSVSVFMQCACFARPLGIGMRSYLAQKALISLLCPLLCIFFEKIFC